ncbi:type I polyketide synthase [Photobacterium gaetbulicola]|uniref:type I polyketide synthase n=1 Tax=Photobacterium gaetbulicola TaxID=1295392 RepID=UPI000689EC73|nr:type I polyketide synthase [Photobacterium gaetbulicola]
MSNKEFLPENGLEVAIVGMAGKFPGAEDIEQYWQLLAEGKEAITFFKDEELDSLSVDPSMVKDPNYIKARGVIDKPEYFDAAFFGIAPREAEIMDPQHRLFLELSWTALENAGYNPDAVPGPVGVFAGAGFNSYMVMKLTLDPSFITQENALQHLFNNDKDYVATRTSYKLNLRGPSVNVQSACSTSLVATHLACQSLLSGESDMVLAGGIAVRVPQNAGYWYQQGSIFSKDGHCRAYDADANGTVSGNGGGVVVLKRLEDAQRDGDRVYAVIKGTAINNDGAGKVGFTAPSVQGEASAIRSAQAIAEVCPDTVRYIEGHGSGTALGDPIELEALTKVFRQQTDKTQYCAISSAKSNIGHLDTAAGMAGLIRAAMSVDRAEILPNANFSRPNPRIDFASSPFYVPSERKPWPEDNHSRRAGVSSFGIGGTNGHIVLEQAPPEAASEPSRQTQLLLCSARTASALKTRCEDLADYFRANKALNLDDVAYTLQVGRKPFEYRAAFVVSEKDDIASIIGKQWHKDLVDGGLSDHKPDIVFMFSGQGSQYPGMAKELYQAYSAFREVIDDAEELLVEQAGQGIRDLLLSTESDSAAELNQTRLTQPALFVVEYALAKLLISLGIRPKAMIGHSIGEYVAAALSGVMTFRDALQLVAYRGELMQGMAEGTMLSIRMPEERVEPLLTEDISLAAVNAPNACVVAGRSDSISQLAKALAAEGELCRELRTSHAFHSFMMQPAVEPFVEAVRNIQLQAPTIPFISNVSGTWVEAKQATNPEYWGQHLRQAVRFAEGIDSLLDLEHPLFVEVGPGNTLSTLAKQSMKRHSDQEWPVIAALPRADQATRADDHFLGALGELWTCGATPDWEPLHQGRSRRRIPLPTYPFERKRYWLTDDGSDAGEEAETLFPQADDNKVVMPTNDIEWSVAAIWQNLYGLDKIGIHENFFHLGGDSMLAIQLVAELQSFFEIELPLAEVLQYPTIAEQAERIAEARRSGGKVVNHSPVVRIQPKGSKPPFFCVHPAGGIVHCYIELARMLGKEQPFYALQHPGIDGKCEPYTRFDVMAEYYIKAIREVQPQGPYYLGGWSFGGTVAYEMAQQLVAMGEEVAVLVMMDTPVPSAVYGADLLRDEFDAAGIFTFLGRGIGQIFGNSLDIDPNELNGLEPEAQFERVLEKAGSINDMSESGAAREQLEQIIDMFRVADSAERQYQPQPYHGKVKLIRVQDLDDYEFTGYKEHPDIKSPTFGWDHVATDLECRMVPGTHMTMVVAPYVREVARTLSAVLAEAHSQNEQPQALTMV